LFIQLIDTFFPCCPIIIGCISTSVTPYLNFNLKPETISKTLVNQMLLFFGTIFASQVSPSTALAYFADFREWLLLLWTSICVVYLRIVLACSLSWALLSSVWKLGKSNIGAKLVLPIFVWAYLPALRFSTSFIGIIKVFCAALTWYNFFSFPGFALISTSNIRTRYFGFGTIYFSGRKSINPLAKSRYI